MTAILADGQALLRAVIDDPEDTAVRLVYADWLEESGEGERSEFIRVQCEMTTLGRLTPEALRGGLPWSYAVQADREDERFLALRRRERELLVAHYRAWFRADLG